MPIYEYQCRRCKAHTEIFQKMDAKPLTRCRKCGGRLEKLLSPPAIQFKGSGWYVTDYARKGSKEEKPESPSTTDKAQEGPPAKKFGPSETTSSSKPARGD